MKNLLNHKDVCIAIKYLKRYLYNNFIPMKIDQKPDLKEVVDKLKTMKGD